MKIKLNLDDELPLNKTMDVPSMAIVFRFFFFHENSKYYPQVFLYKI